MNDPWARMHDDPWVKAVEQFEPRARELAGLGPDDDPRDLVAMFEHQGTRAAEAEARLAAAEFTATSDNGLIRVTITGRGALLALDLDDGVFLRYRPAELGTAILATIEDAQGQCAELLREVLGEVLTDASVVDGIVAAMPGRRRAADDPVEPADWA